MCPAGKGTGATNNIGSLYLHNSFHKARVCPTGFGTTFAALIVLIYCLRELSLSAVTDHFELRCPLKQLLLSNYKVCPCYSRLQLARTGLGF